MMVKYLALDFETFLLDNEKPWESPKPVCLSWCSSDGKWVGVADNVGDSLYRQLDFLFNLAEKEDYHHVWQNGYGFDLLVIWNWFPELRERLINLLDTDKVHDTLIRERLYDLSTIGEISQKKGRYSLANMVKKYVGRDISKYKEGEDIWRLRYGELDGVPLHRYPDAAYQYAIEDVILLNDVFLAQEWMRQSKGPGSMNTESLQIKSAFVLNLAYQRGLQVNQERLKFLESSLDEKLAPLKQLLIDKGFAHIDKKGRFIKHQKEFTQYIEQNYSDFVKRTAPTKTHPKGQVATDDSALAELPPDEIVQCRRDMSILEKYRNTYIANIRKAGFVFHEKYDILKETGRTSSFIQTMPKEGGIRELFEARDGYKYAIIDYAHLEADVMAQTYKNLGLSSGLMEYLNTGADYHALIGSSWYNSANNSKLTPKEFEQRKSDPEIKRFRTLGKPAGLGLSGGIGPNTLMTTAKGQGVELSLEDAIASLRFAEESIPGLVEFRGRWRTSEKGWLGAQKLVGKKKVGVYKNDDGKEITIIEDKYGYEVNGRWRNNCTYCALANGLSMQSAAADGAKEAIWECFKYCFKTNCHLLFFVHDELGFEVPKDADEEHLMELSRYMCEGMQKILPDIRITVEGGLYSYWTKDDSKASFKSKYWRTPEGEFKRHEESIKSTN